MSRKRSKYLYSTLQFCAPSVMKLQTLGKSYYLLYVHPVHSKSHENGFKTTKIIFSGGDTCLPGAYNLMNLANTRPTEFRFYWAHIDLHYWAIRPIRPLPSGPLHFYDWVFRLIWLYYYWAISNTNLFREPCGPCYFFYWAIRPMLIFIIGPSGPLCFCD